MRRTVLPALTMFGILGVATLAAARTPQHAATRDRQYAALAPTQEIVAIYFGTMGTDAGGMGPVVRDMKTSLAREARTAGRSLFSLGVSLEPSVDDGVRHLALLGAFDEISVGGNWANSSVVRYLGASQRDDSTRIIPQVVLVERVRQNNERMEIGPERVLRRIMGVDSIALWVRNGTPIPR